MDHVGGRVVHFQQLAQVQAVQFHGGIHLAALGAEDVAQCVLLQSDALHQVDDSLVQRDLGQAGA